MNVFQAAMMSEQYFENVMAESGYERFTTFSSDLTIAELMGGQKAIEETFNRVVKEWKDDVKYFTEFAMALNIKAWEYMREEMSNLQDCTLNSITLHEIKHSLLSKVMI